VAEHERGEDRDAYEAVFTALAHPVRRRILLTVYFKGGSMTAGEIAGMFEQAWPTTTRHLQVLESAGLLRHQRQGRIRRYQIDCHRLNLVRDWLAWFSRNPGGNSQRGQDDQRRARAKKGDQKDQPAQAS
jgi:DNA-binding transcriptional ArsR family regulator